MSATITTISFDSPKQYGVKATAGRDVSVIGNVFSKVQFGGLVHFNNFAGATHIAIGFAGVGFLYAPFVFPAISGSIVAERNVVDDVGTEVINTHSGECFGLGALATTAAVRYPALLVRGSPHGLQTPRKQPPFYWQTEVLLSLGPFVAKFLNRAPGGLRWLRDCVPLSCSRA